MLFLPRSQQLKGFEDFLYFLYIFLLFSKNQLSNFLHFFENWFFKKIKNLKSQVFLLFYFKIFFKITVLVRDISFKVVITPSLPIPEYFQPPKGISNDLKNEAPLIIAPPHSS